MSLSRRAYYNEKDAFVAAWLRELIKAGLIADGEVDERSIEDVAADDVRGFAQCHFFAGIGGWSYALRLAGWPDGREVWTGSCPCQPFSSAGSQAGGHDPRDLWPTWFQLIAQCRPIVVFGEQVEAAIAHAWLDRVCDDLEREGYAVGPCGLPAASVGAFHLRQRLWFVAESSGSERRALGAGRKRASGGWTDAESSGSSDAGDMGHANESRSQGRGIHAERAGECAAGSPSVERLADAEHAERWPLSLHRGDGCDRQNSRWPEAHGEFGTCGEVCAVAGADERRCEIPNLSIRPTGQDEAEALERRSGFWSAVDWIPCADGKARPIEPTIFPLAYGIPNRVGLLRGAGNAIVPELAAEFIKAYREAVGEVL